MKRTIIVFAAALTLAACAGSDILYQPAQQ